MHLMTLPFFGLLKMMKYIIFVLLMIDNIYYLEILYERNVI